MSKTKAELGFAINYDGTYSNIVMVKKRCENHWKTVGGYYSEFFIDSEVFATFTAAKREVIKYFQDHIESYRWALREARATRYSTICIEAEGGRDDD